VNGGSGVGDVKEGEFHGLDEGRGNIFHFAECGLRKTVDS
jgi:hypothetical protein